MTAHVPIAQTDAGSILIAVVHTAWRVNAYRSVVTKPPDPSFAFTMDDMSRYGKVEFFAGDDRVLGVDITADAPRGFEYERCRFFNVFAFAPGQWMKDLVEVKRTSTLTKLDVGISS